MAFLLFIVKDRDINDPEVQQALKRLIRLPAIQKVTENIMKLNPDWTEKHAQEVAEKFLEYERLKAGQSGERSTESGKDRR